jgi:hypothetical protein
MQPIATWNNNACNNPSGSKNNDQHRFLTSTPTEDTNVHRSVTPGAFIFSAGTSGFDKMWRQSKERRPGVSRPTFQKYSWVILRLTNSNELAWEFEKHSEGSNILYMKSGFPSTILS